MKQLEAYLEFESLNLDEYIFDLDIDIKTKLFPLERQTRGDFSHREISSISEINSNRRVFKTILYNLSDLAGSNIYNNFNQSVGNDVYNSDHVVNNQFKEEVVHKVIEEIKQDIVNNEFITQENFESKTEKISNDLSQNITEKVTNNFIDILQSKIDQSNNFTLEQVEEYDNQLTILNQNTFLQHNAIKVIEQVILDRQDEIKTELKQDINKNKKEIEDFLNS